MVTLTQNCKDLFLAYAEDAGNWNGMPLVGGNVGGSKADAGALVHLKKQGLLTTSVSDGLSWISFTDKGREFALENGVTIYTKREGS